MSLTKPNKAKLVLLESLLSSKIRLNSCSTEHFISKGACGICVSRCLKEGLA